MFKCLTLLVVAGMLGSCNDFLDKTPESTISPENYFSEESQLAAYDNGLYTSILPSHGNWSYGTFGTDEHTDNQAYVDYNSRYVPGQWKTAQTESTNWYFKYIYSCNYFLENVIPKYKAGEITGSTDNIKHYIGEMYFLRAYEYFNRYQMFGDFPIITKTLVDNQDSLVAASKRYPRNEVARFIISDLDSAIVYMATTPDANKTRINKESALLLKSRVALFEATWLKYFKGTAFVPGDTNWPGKDKSYNANFSYTAGSIDKEIDWFLAESMDAAKKCADDFTLCKNTGKVQQSASDAVNPYMDMFGSTDLSGYSEVLMWRQYSTSVTHCVVVAAQYGDCGVGVTRGLVNGFLMANGLPIYATGSGYQGDDSITTIRGNRDTRLSCFLKEPGQKNILYEDAVTDHWVSPEPYPDITSGSAEKKYTTGYALRKGGSFYESQCGNGACYTGSITFRGAEAYLNYMEACYELNGSLDETAKNYWVALRERAGVNTDFQKTIDNTDMAEEAKWDWGAYSGGKLIDATLFNIRRERRCELMAEGLRYMDLRRWRAMDQMISTPYHIEGFKLWGPMLKWYDSSSLIYEGGTTTGTDNVSSPTLSEYLRPYEINPSSLAYDGYKWTAAHYLYPICNEQFLITASDRSDLSTSPLYQNPGWPTTANSAPTTVPGW